jgi:UDP-glucuronate decarboxylase
MKTVLITGGCGFLGFNLMTSLLKDDRVSKIVLVDNFITSNRTKIKNFLEIYKGNCMIELIEGDICSLKTIEQIKENKEAIEEIYHMASLASPRLYKRWPIETLDVGYIGTKNILELTRHYRCKMLYTSTSEVYGDAREHPQKETYYGNVNTVGERSCFSEDTEILTKEGFKYFKDLQSSDYVCTLNKKGSIEYHIPDEIIQQKYVGDMYNFKNWNIDLNVTPDHKMYVKRRNHNQFELLPAKSTLVWDRSVLRKTCEYVGEEKQWFYFPNDVKNLRYQKCPYVEKIDMDLWLEFMGYYLSKGHTRIATQKKRCINGKVYDTRIFKVQVSQCETANPQKFIQIKKCLDKLPFHYNISRAGNCYFVISNKQLATYLHKFGKSRDKYIPSELLSVSKRQLSILLDALMLGDGTVYKQGKKYISSSYRLMSGIQEILLKMGTFGNIIQTTSDDSQKKTAYNITINSRPERNYTYSEPTVHQYDGCVYCVNVKNHVIYVRRNGKALFCGNCYDESKRISETLIYTYTRMYELDTRIVRIFNTYGPHMSITDGRIVTEIMRSLIWDETLNIFGDGRQTRSLSFVEDTVKMIISVMNGNYKNPINVGNDEEITINELVNICINEYRQYFKKNPNIRIVYTSIDKDDPKVRKPCLELNKQLLPNNSKTKLKDGILKTIQYFYRNY